MFGVCDQGIAVAAVPWGGYASAERTRIAIVRSDLEATLKDTSQVRQECALVLEGCKTIARLQYCTNRGC